MLKKGLKLRISQEFHLQDDKNDKRGNLVTYSQYRLYDISHQLML